MTTPIIYDFPVRRPGFIVDAHWDGPDQQLQLKLAYYNELGQLRGINLSTRNIADGAKGEVCLPSSSVLTDLGPRWEDVLTAHTRMACLVARSGIPGSTEFQEALLGGETANLQTAIGVVKIVDVTPINDQTVRMTYKQGTGPSMTIDQEYQNLNRYVFVPDTQLFVIPGAIKKQFPTYVHDYPTKVLTEAQKNDIAAYVLTLAPWI